MSRNRAAKLLSDPYTIVRRPIMTEKTHDMASTGQEGGEEGDEKAKNRRYTFDVHPKANKNQIRLAIEAAFGVKVYSVNTMIVKPRKKAFRGAAAGRPGFTRTRKKAVIKLTADSKPIDLM